MYVRLSAQDDGQTKYVRLDSTLKQHKTLIGLQTFLGLQKVGTRRPRDRLVACGGNAGTGRKLPPEASSNLRSITPILAHSSRSLAENNHGHHQVHRRRLPRRTGRQRRHPPRSPPAVLRKDRRLRAQLAGYRSRELVEAIATFFLEKLIIDHMFWRMDVKLLRGQAHAVSLASVTKTCSFSLALLRHIN